MVNYSMLSKRLKKSCKEVSRQYYNFMNDVRKAQERKLYQILKNNSDTIFGRRYNFNKIKSTYDFRSTVPITTYEDYEDYITQIADGGQNVLTRDKVLMLEPTSGSTSPSKFIPYTNSLKEEFQAGIFPWLFDLLDNKPSIGKGSFYWSITPVTQKQEITSGGIPIGFGDDTAYFTQDQQMLISQLSAVPFDVAQIQNMDEFRGKTLEHLTQNSELSFISVWNPTFLSLLLRPIDNPNELWPNLSLISSWADGNASSYIHSIQELFPNAEIQGKGLIATEGFISFPLIGYDGSALSINSHFFEFRDIDDKEDVRLAHEVEMGREYETIITTGGGFYRYNLEDVIKVVGFKNQCPLIRFIGRNNNVSDLFGEKLNEYHVSKVVNKTLEDYSIDPSFYMVAPTKIESQSVPSYTLFVESSMDPLNLPDIVNSLDEGLQENFHYKYCRRLGQLDKPRIFLIKSGSEETATDIYLKEGQSRGKKIGNVKSAMLDSNFFWPEKFNGNFI